MEGPGDQELGDSMKNYLAFGISYSNYLFIILMRFG